MGWLLEFFMSLQQHHHNDILVQVRVTVSPRPWWIYSATPLGNQATSTMTWYPLQSHYSDTELISRCPILLMLCARLGNDKYQFLSHQFDSTRKRTPDLLHVMTILYRFGSHGGWWVAVCKLRETTTRIRICFHLISYRDNHKLAAR